MKYTFHPEALQEYVEATMYYTEVCFELGESFLYEIERGIQQILDNPKAWQIVEEDIRRYLVHRFPFGIYYTVEDDCILIVAIMHMSREPGYWKNRIKFG
ncbi:MAG: type II toxin-antitoxin system RelE/ParE family toxin [Nitrospirota bacterium]